MHIAVAVYLAHKFDICIIISLQLGTAKLGYQHLSKITRANNLRIDVLY